MDELAGTENRIAVERMRYNERVQEYNTARRSFPANITAGDLRLQGIPALPGAESAKVVAEGRLRAARGPTAGSFAAGG